MWEQMNRFVRPGYHIFAYHLKSVAAILIFFLLLFDRIFQYNFRHRNEKRKKWWRSIRVHLFCNIYFFYVLFESKKIPLHEEKMYVYWMYVKDPISHLYTHKHTHTHTHTLPRCKMLCATCKSNFSNAVINTWICAMFLSITQFIKKSRRWSNFGLLTDELNRKKTSHCHMIDSSLNHTFFLFTFGHRSITFDFNRSWANLKELITK